MSPNAQTYGRSSYAPMNSRGRLGTTPAPRSQRPAGNASGPVIGLPLSAAQAIPVDSVREEYAWLQRNLRPGWKREMQSLVPMGGRSYDVLRVRHADGTTKDYWFDVTSILGAIGAAVPSLPAGNISLNINGGKITVSGTEEGATCSNRRACALPSSDSACDLMNGDLNAIPRVLFHCAGRSALIGFGIFLFGERDWRKIVRGGVGAAVVIEAFALFWAGLHRDPTAP